MGQPIKTESQERVTKENIPEGLQDFCNSLEIFNGNDYEKVTPIRIV